MKAISMQREQPYLVDSKGVLDSRNLPDTSFLELWNSIIVDNEVKDRLLGQAVLNFTLRPKLKRASVPLHGIILLVGRPGTGKTSLARGLAARVAEALPSKGKFRFLEIEPHALASAALGKSQQAVRHLLGTVIAEQAALGPLVVLLDEVETLASDRTKMSLEANPVDVHRATDAVLAQLDHLAVQYPDLLFVATSNFETAIDAAFLSRADLIEVIDLPGAQACEEILRDTVLALAEVYPKLKRIVDEAPFRQAAKRAVGLDARRIRKAVLSALARDKRTAANPELLTSDAVLSAVEQAGGDAKQKERR